MNGQAYTVSITADGENGFLVALQRNIEEGTTAVEAAQTLHLAAADIEALLDVEPPVPGEEETTADAQSEKVRSLDSRGRGALSHGVTCRRIGVFSR